MDEGGGLENRYMGNCIVGSNPTPSASPDRNNRKDIYQIAPPQYLSIF